MKEANKNHTKSSLDLKSRLFEKGLNYSTLGPLKSPLASDTPTPNRNLLVNLASSKYVFFYSVHQRIPPKSYESRFLV